MAGAAVIYVQNLDPMAAFYQGCFGMSAAESDERYRVLESRDWNLSLVLMPAEISASIVMTSPPQRRAGTPVKLAFDVDSIEAASPVIGRAGGQVDPLTSAWDFRGFRHLDCLDPEGNVVQLRQRLPAG
jgi:predicted enzyme related to lactoylglutathione lyase